jgi:predicted TIM-barrel fold metal-dependent hydrolase
LDKLDQDNIVAVRFNLKRGGSEGKKYMVRLSNLLYDQFGWRTELYVDSKELKELDPILSQIPKFSIDHLGLSKEGLTNLYYWAEKGVKIKATGFGRIDFDPIPVMKKICKINPTALMFGTDLPSTRAPVPFHRNDIDLIKAHFSEREQENIFYKNATAWYNRNR